MEILHRENKMKKMNKDDGLSGLPIRSACYIFRLISYANIYSFILSFLKKTMMTAKTI